MAKANEMVNVSGIKVMKETEKAVAFEGTKVYSTCGYPVTIWVPKSLIVNNKVPSWFFGKKAAELHIDLAFEGVPMRMWSAV